MKAVKLATVSAAVLLSTSAMANVVTNTAGSVVDGTKTLFKTATNPAAVSLEVGTLGYGANVAWALNDTVELQAGWTGGDPAGLFKDDIKVDGNTFDLDTDYSNPYLGVQMRPAANWFTVGAGIIVPDNDIKVKADGAGGKQFDINGQSYTVTGVVEGQIEHRNKLAPYLTFGFRPNINNHWGIFGEVGATYLGHADVTIKNASGEANGFNAAAAQAIEDKDYITWYPIVKVGATYRF